MLNRFFRRMAPIAVMALSAGLAGCNEVKVRMGESDGVPLPELDMSGDPPTSLAMMGPDTVIISEGDALAIKAEGDNDVVEALRFTLEDGGLGIMRDPEAWDLKGRATIRVTMPAPEELAMAGSGRIETPTMANRAEISIGGSGSVDVANFSSEQLEVNIGGSGKVTGAGSAERLEVSIGGSGNVRLDALKAERAEIAIAGSGDVRFASDGVVDASIAGSGDVIVTGRAKCTVSALGSGSLTCKAPAETETAE